ncbi:MAG: hypothetical protein M0P71_01505 [Melioribacteraceae bacterium]|nr:hypothetical protein [Melioribacteraceae bacterium]
MVRFNIKCVAIENGNCQNTELELSKAEDNNIFADGTYPTEISTDSLLLTIPGIDVRFVIGIKDLDLILRSTRG